MDFIREKGGELKLSEIKEEGRQKALEMKVIEVCEHIIATGDSNRKTAKLFNISAPTVNDYCKRFKVLKPLRYKELEKVINNNTESTIKDEKVKKRVLEHTKLILEGYTFEEIVESTGNDYWVIYRDVKKRLKNIDEGLFNKVGFVLKSHSINNLNNQYKK